VQPIPFTTLYHANHGWLDTHYHFSFAEYYDSQNKNYGVLRVMNDDVIAPYSGFREHPHRDMEIITYVIKGALTHQDSMGNKESVGRGSIQYLSAGTGIIHSEKNESSTPLHLVQIWILPNAKGLTPRYGSKTFDENLRHNRWLHLIAPEGTPDVTTIYQDANIYVTQLDKEKILTFECAKNRQLYLKILEGEANINETPLHRGDAGTLQGKDMRIEALQEVHILVIEMALAY